MKWTYGKRDFMTMERALENCFLMTNGLGGYSATSMSGAVTRGDQGVLIAAIKSPNVRYCLVHRLSEKVDIEGEDGFWLSSQEYVSNRVDHDNLDEFIDIDNKKIFVEQREDGYKHISCFTYEDTPVWLYHYNGIEIRKEMAMEPGKNTVAVVYDIENKTNRKATLSVTPFVLFAPKGEPVENPSKICYSDGMISLDDIKLHVKSNGTLMEIEKTENNCFYRHDICDGRRYSGDSVAVMQIAKDIEAGESTTIEIVFEMDKSRVDATTVIAKQKQDREDFAKQAGFKAELANELAKSAKQFVSHRESTNGSTILAGFPFFADWGRDTMISLYGICIATKQFEMAKSMLRTFAMYEHKGLIPNLFPEGESEPWYNTVDAALIFIISCYQYYLESKDIDFMKEMYPTFENIVNGYRIGTDYSIHMDEDGLIMAGSGYDLVTWMDARTDDVLPTRRHGKPVEINAYWYNVICIMIELHKLDIGNAMDYVALSKKIKQSFNEKFWMEDKGYLKDLVSGTYADEQFRCNQIWAVSLPFDIIDLDKQKRVVDMVYNELYTPYGLRTLSPNDKEYKPYYGGEVLIRDLAYHQGTTWVLPLGGYYIAYLKVNNYSDGAKHKVSMLLEMFEGAMREGCIAQLPEIYDGCNPTLSRGCFAQAWSVGEILRVYRAIEG